VAANTAVAVTFSTAMDPSTLTAQTAAGACSGAIQVSLDNFASCVAMSSSSAAMSSGNTIATFTPQPGLLVNWTFKIRVTTGAVDAAGGALASQYTQATGFTTGNPPGATAQNESNSLLEANYCNIQFPTSLTVQTGMSSGLVYGQLYEAGLTPSGGTNPNLVAQLGYGPLAANPEYQSGWTWVNAAYNSACGGCANNDEYQASFTAPAAGTYGYVYRVSLDQGVSWTYCDKDGAGSNPGLIFSFDQIAILTVTP
jgi:hypothetical protein